MNKFWNWLKADTAPPLRVYRWHLLVFWLAITLIVVPQILYIITCLNATR